MQGLGKITSRALIGLLLIATLFTTMVSCQTATSKDPYPRRSEAKISDFDAVTINVREGNHTTDTENITVIMENNVNFEIFYTRHFRLEILENDEWYAFEHAGFMDAIFSLYAKETKEVETRLMTMSGNRELESGTYRILIYFYEDMDNPADGRFLAAEFTIVDE